MINVERLVTGIEPEVEGQNRFRFAHPKTRAFLLAAQADGAFERAAERHPIWPRWEDVMNIYYDTELTFREIGQSLGLTAKNQRSRPQQMMSMARRVLHGSCSPEIRQRFPLNQIPIGKPLTELSRERMSQAGGGLMLRVRKGVRAGLSREEIGETVNSKSGGVRDVLRALKKRGEAVPLSRIEKAQLSRIEKAQQFLQRAKDAKTFSEIEQILADSSRSIAKSHPELFVSVSDVVREAGFRFRRADLRAFLMVLDRFKIPYRKFEVVNQSGKEAGQVSNYYVVLRQQAESIGQTFRFSKTLQEFRRLKSLRQIGGPKVDLPNTTNVRKMRGFRTIGRELERLGVESSLLAASPVPVFLRPGPEKRTLVREGDYEILMDYVGRLLSAQE